MLCGAVSNIVMACPTEGCLEHVLRDPADDIGATIEEPRGLTSTGVE